MDFAKYQGAGNDFIVVDNMDLSLIEKGQIAKKVCHRHFGVGADGFIAAEPSDVADVKMAFYNSDGTRASMCGNGLRCFSRFIHESKIVFKDSFTVETGDGIKEVNLIRGENHEYSIRVFMGYHEELSTDLITVNQRTFQISSTHLGVPHTVIFFDLDKLEDEGVAMDILSELAIQYGSAIEHAPIFPNRANVNFTSVVDSQTILCSTWERGAGKTLGCGTGACSSALAAFKMKACDNQIRVKMPGGEVVVTIQPDKGIYMEGNAAIICKGEIPLSI